MSLPLATATLRADLRRELVRLRARPHEGGPFFAAREGELLVFDDSGERCWILTREILERLRALPDGAGAAEAWRSLEQP